MAGPEYYWTPEQDQMIIDLRADKKPWKEISRRVGRSVEACSFRYRRLVPTEKRFRFVAKRMWSDEDDVTLGTFLDERRTVIQIARLMKRTKAVIYYRIDMLRNPIGNHPIDPKIHVPMHLVEERDRRYAAERDLTAMFFGDPPFSQSALGKREERA